MGTILFCFSMKSGHHPILLFNEEWAVSYFAHLLKISPTWLTAPSPPSRIFTTFSKHSNVSARHGRLFSGADVRRGAPQAEHKQPLAAGSKQRQVAAQLQLDGAPDNSGAPTPHTTTQPPNLSQTYPISQLAHLQAGFHERVHEYRENGTSGAFNWAQPA